jgi:hypothetical protein
VDGCELRCAARATELFSGKPAASLVVTDVVKETGIGPLEGLRRLNEAGQKAVEATAHHMAFMVDDLLGKQWSRRQGHFVDDEILVATLSEPRIASCTCGSGIPVQTVEVAGEQVTLIALPVLFEQFQQAGKLPTVETAGALLEQVGIYNQVPEDLAAAYLSVLQQEYANFCAEKEPVI